MLDPVSPEAADQSLLAKFVAHWRALPRTNGLPTLATYLDHTDPRFAPWTTIVDIKAGNRLPIRLIGTRMVETFGEHTGGDFLAVMPADVRAVVWRAHQQIVSLPCGWHTESKVVTTGGREVITEL